MIFKIGERVYDCREGDVGVIKQAHYNWKNPDFQDGWWILWETGDATGERLWLSESDMALVENNE